MAEEKTSSVRITQGDIYKKQLEHGDILIKVLEKLDHLDDVPERIREVELTLAKLAWIERIAYTGLSAAVIASGGLARAGGSLILTSSGLTSPNIVGIATSNSCLFDAEI
jgi:hypothetical protein